MLDHITVFPAVRKVKGNDDHSLIEKTFLVNNIKVVMFPISSCLLNYQTNTHYFQIYSHYVTLLSLVNFWV